MLVLLVADLAVDPLARPDPGDRDRGDARRGLHPAPRAALAARRARLLAGAPRRRGAAETRPRLGARVGSSSRGARGRSIALVAAGLLVLALGNFTHHGTIGFGQGETQPTNSSRGTKVLDEHFPPGLGSPLTAVVPAEERRRSWRG